MDGSFAMADSNSFLVSREFSREQIFRNILRIFLILS